MVLAEPGTSCCSFQHDLGCDILLVPWHMPMSEATAVPQKLIMLPGIPITIKYEHFYDHSDMLGVEPAIL